MADALGNEAFLAIMQAPRVTLARKLELVENAFGDSVTNETKVLLQLLLRRRSIGVFGDVHRWFLELADHAERIDRITVITAIPLSDDMGKAVRQRLQRDGRQVVLTEQVDPSIIGGLLIRQNDIVQDFSVRGRLDVMRDQLVANP